MMWKYSLCLLTLHVLSAPATPGCPAACRCVIPAVDCAGRQLTSVPTCSDLGKHLHILYVSRNNITQLPADAFLDFRHVKRMRLDNNHIHQIDLLTFKQMRSLKKLSFVNNGLRNLNPEIFVANPSLTTLSLSGNPLKLSTNFLFSESITSLDLSRCSLDYLPPDVFAKLIHLQNLILTHNLLESLPAGFFDNLPKLKRIYLHGNPWRCDGDMEELMMSKQDVIADYKKIHCVTWDGEQRVWSQGSWKSIQRIAFTEPWIQEALETNSSNVFRVVMNPADSSSDSNDEIKDLVSRTLEEQGFRIISYINVALVCVIIIALGLLGIYFPVQMRRRFNL